MSLLPMAMHNFPVIFLEARMLGQPSAHIISQLGISVDAPDCSVAVFNVTMHHFAGHAPKVTVIRIRVPEWFSRASGVLLVAGVGSYCAYRICTKFLGKRFVWMLLESSHCDQLSSAELRLLHPPHLEPVDEDSDHQDDEGDRRSESEWLERVSGSRPASEMSIGRLSRVRRSTRAKGLLGLHQSRTPRSGVLRREGSSVSGSVRSPARRAISPSGSECSASLRIVFEGQQMWDDEFEDQPQPSMLTRVGPMAISSLHPSPSHPEGVQPAHSMGDLCSVFDDILSITTREDHMEFGGDFGDETFREEIEEEEEESVQQGEGEDRESHPDEEIMRLKCMTDSKYMYQSVVVGSEFGGSQAASVFSARSAASNLHSLKKKLNRTVKPNGLWDLTHDVPSTSTADLRVPNPMTDSGLSSGMRSETGKSAGKRSLFDSALGPEVFSSEEDDLTADHRLYSRNHPLHRISDESERMSVTSAAMSVTSLEWFDDGLKPSAHGDCLGDLSGDIRVPINGLDFDFESLRIPSESGRSSVVGGPVKREQQQHTNSQQQQLPSRKSSHQNSPSPNTLRRPKDTRDTMVFACEKIQPYSAQFKTVQSLYSRRRLKRVGAPVTDASSLMQNFLSSALYHNAAAIKEQSKNEMLKEFDRCYNRYDVLHRWGNDGDNELTHLREKISSLWDLIHNPPTTVDESCVDSVRLFLLLRSIDIFERNLAGTREFEWFTAENPMETAQLLQQNVPSDALWRLLAWSFGVRCELIDISTKLQSTTTENSKLHFGDPGAPTLYWLSQGVEVYPMFYVPDE